LDLFARPLPRLNIDGVEKVSSCVGLIFSVILYVILMAITASRLVVLFGEGNPIVSQYKIESEYELLKKVNLDDFGFNIAFKVERINDDESRTTVHDEDMVDYVIEIVEKNDKKAYGSKATVLDYHKCNSSDY